MMTLLQALLAQAAPVSGGVDNSGGAGAAIFAGGFFIFFMAIVVLTSIFWLWMLVDCLMSSLPAMEKLVWIVVIVFLHIVGALLYFFIARGGRSQPTV